MLRIIRCLWARPPPPPPTQTIAVQRARRRCFLCWQFANELLFFERVCSSRLRFWTAHWSDSFGNNTSQSGRKRSVSLHRPGCCTTRTVKASRRPPDVTTGHVPVSRERKDQKKGSTACLTCCQCRVISWRLWNGVWYPSMALRRMWGTAVKFRLFWPWHCNDVRRKLNATDRFTLEKVCMVFSK
jgi:hypothetical protein